MSLHWRQRRILLFIIAIIVPALALTLLGLRLIGQERELAQKRLVEDQQRWASDIRQELSRRLELVKLQESSAWLRRGERREASLYEHPVVVLVCPVEKGRLILPWESNEQAQGFQRLLADDEFAQKIAQGEQEEFADKRFVKAAETYRRAMRAARHQAQGVYAELSLARALARSGLAAEADRHYRAVLAAPATTDDQGAPLALYAAERLIKTGGALREILELLRSETDGRAWVSPTEAYLLRDLAEALINAAPEDSLREAAREIQRKTFSRIRDLEQAMALQHDFPALALSERPPRHQESQWIAYGVEPWLVGLAPSLDGTVVVAARARDIFASLGTINGHADAFAGRAELIVGGEAGDPLGADFPSLRINFTGRDERAMARSWNLQRAFYGAALLLVLSGTLLSAWLLWRDVRRELRLAEIRSQFVSSVSHELKTPLTAIRLFAETLRMGRSVDRQTQTEYLDTIVNESERLTRLLNNVLDFSKIEQGKKSYHFAPVSLAEITRSAVRAMEYPLSQQGFDLRVEIKDDPPPMTADGDALQQAILNLLNNAMKYSGESREIGLRLRQQDGWAAIEVEDRGLGVAPGEREKIFEQFYRAEAPENSLIPGTGLGLTLVANVAKAHGGRVEIKSVVGEGSVFSIHLPLEAAR